MSNYNYAKETYAKYGIDTIAKLPIDPVIPAMCDKGMVEKIDSPWLDDIVSDLKELI